MSVVGQRNPRWKSSFALIWTNSAAAELLRDLEPRLIIKSRQAAALLSYQDRVRATGRRRRSNGSLMPTAERERLRRQTLFLRVRELNTRNRVVRERNLARPTSDGPTRLPSPAYLAGLVDGEGSLMIVRSKASNRRNPEFRARISVANTDANVLCVIRGRFGGILVNQPPRETSWNPAYQLIWSDGMAAPVLTLLLPHLRIKYRQARLLLDFIAHKRETPQGRFGRSFASLSPAEIATREAFHKDVSAPNARGTG